MPHQFLHHLQFRTRCTEKCRVGSAKCVPTNPLCDAQPLRRGADVVTKKLLSPIWGFSSFLGTGEHPTLRRSKWCSAMPAPQGADTAALCTLAHPLNRVAVVEIVPTGWALDHDP